MTEQKNYLDDSLTKYILINMAITALAVIVSLIIYLPRARGIFFPEDEFGYWSNAALINGKDWHILASQNATYSYGYSLLLAVLMKVFSTPVSMYKAAIVLNGILVVIYSGLSTFICCSLFGLRKKFYAFIFAFYPSVLIFMHYSIAESLLNVVFLLLCIAVYDICKNGISIYRFVKGLAISAILCIVHYRTVGVLAAYILLCLYLHKGSKTTMDITIAAVIIGVIVYFTIGIDYLKIKSFYHLGYLITGLLGKAFYIGIASYGIALLGLVDLLRTGFKLIAGKGEAGNESESTNSSFSFFILSSTLAMMIISSYYFIEGIRLDQPIYGRYIDMFVPFLIVFGIESILKTKELFMKIAGCVVFLGVTSAVLTQFASINGITDYLGNYITGVDYIFGYAAPSVNSFYSKPFYFAVIIMILMSGIIHLIVNRHTLDNDNTVKPTGIVTCIMTVLFLAIAMYSPEKHVYRYQDLDESDYELVELIDGLIQNGYELHFLDYPYNKYINLIQFWEQSITIDSMPGYPYYSGMVPENSIIITYINHEQEDKIREDFSTEKQTAHFLVFYNDVVY